MRTAPYLRSFFRYGLPCLVLLSLAAFVPGAARAEEGKQKNAADTTFFERALRDVRVGTPAQWGQLTVFPLVVEKAPAAMAVDVAWDTPTLRVHDRTDRAHEYDVVLQNESDRPTLVLGGTVLQGGKMERLVPMDVLIGARSGKVELDVLAASMRQRLVPKKERQDLRPASVAAPKYLREKVLYSPSSRLVRRFLRHFDQFRPEGAPPTLSGVSSAAAIQQFCVACRGESQNFPRLRRPTTVGFITAYGTRLQSMELFGSNDLLTRCFDPILTSHSFRAAAVAARAEERKQKLPEVDGQALQKEANALLEKIRKRARVRTDEVAGDSAGAALGIWVRGARGRAIGLDGRLVHATIFPHDPFEHALYADPIEHDPESGDYGDGIPTEYLERRGARGRLTEFERRLLERRKKMRTPAEDPIR